MAFALVAGQTGTIRTNSVTLQTVSINLLNSSGELCAVGYDRLPTNVTLTVAVTGSAVGGSSAVITVSSGSQFAAGDNIYISTSTFSESATVQSVSGNNLTLAGVPYFNHNIGDTILRFTNNQTLCVAIFNPVGDYIVNAPKVTINGTATDLQLVDFSAATGTVSAINGQSLLWVLPILSAQTNTQTTGYTITCSATNLAGAYQSIHFNAMTFTGANIPSSTTNANLPKTSGGTLIDGFSGTFESALVMAAGSPPRIDLGTVNTSYDTQQQPFIAIAASTNTAFPSNYFRTIATGVKVDSSNNVTGALVSAITCTGTSGASTITVSSAPNTAGFVSNGVYTISDGANTETVQLNGTFVGATTTLTLVSPLVSSHTAASITCATGFLPANAMSTLVGVFSHAWGVSGSAVVRTSNTAFLPANGTQLYIHANGVGEPCNVSSGGGTNILTMTSNLSRSYQNGIISTLGNNASVVSPYGGYTIQYNSVATVANPAVLNGASGTGTKTSLTVNALPAQINSGTQLLLRQAASPATTQLVTTSATAVSGATTISINSVSFATNFASGTTLVNTGTGAPLTGQFGGLIGTTLYPSNASVNNLTAFTQPSGQSIMTTGVPLIATTAGQSSATSSTLVGTSPYPVGSQQFQASTTVNSYVQNFRTATTSSGTIAGNFMMFGGYNYGGTPFITPEILINAGGSGTFFSGWGYIYTFVPASPAITRAGAGIESPTTRASSLKGALKSNAETLSATIRGVRIVAVVRNAASQITTVLGATKFRNIIKSATQNASQSIVATKIQGYVASASTALTRTIVAVKSIGAVKSARQTLSQSALASSFKGAVKSASQALAQTAIATSIRGVVKSGNEALRQASNSVTLTAYENAGISYGVSTAVASKFLIMLKSATSKVTQKTVGVKARTILSSASNNIRQSALATTLVDFTRQAASSLGEVVVGVKQIVIAVVIKVVGVAIQSMTITSGKVVGYVASAANTTTQSLAVHKVVAFSRQAANALNQAVVATRSTTHNLSGQLSTVMKVRSRKASEFLRSSSQTLAQDVGGVRIVARVRSNALALVSATVATRSAEMNKVGASSSQAVIRATRARVSLRANSQALRIVATSTKQAIFSRSGFDTLFQTARFASFIYTIAHTLPAIFKETAKQLAQADPRISAFSEITERGLYREQPTQQTFNEDATQIFTEGQ